MLSITLKIMLSITLKLC